MASNENLILQQRIRNTFPMASSPIVTEITEDELRDASRVRESLNGHKWWLVKGELIDENFDCLSLLTPDAYHYYLPAFLLRSLELLEPNNDVLEFTVFSLSPTKTLSTDPWFGRRLKKFSREEVQIIRSFLSLLISDERMYSLRNDAERGLRKFWTDSSEVNCGK